MADQDTNTEVEEQEEGVSEEAKEVLEQAEKDARSMGWRPEKEWDGPPGKWVDAKTFIERGELILPILRANNKKMKEELLTRDKELATLKESVKAANKALEALRKGHNEATKREVETAIAELKEQFRQAREAGDVDLELRVKDNIDNLTAKAKKIGEESEEETPPDKKDDKAPALHPDFVAWQAENKWFGNTANKDDKERSDNLLKVAEKVRIDEPELSGRPFMDRCMEILEERERGYARPRSSKVETGGERRASGGGRAWDSLPKEAKEACHADADTFVGPGKMFKEVKQWEDHYAKLYNQQG